MVIKSLNGYSGCKVLLCQDEKSKYVRKISPFQSYNDRLESQSQKQERFNGEEKYKIKTPKIFRKGYIENLFYFDMEYISGNSMSDFLCNTDISSIRPHISVIIDYLSESETTGKKDISQEVSKKVKNIGKSSSKYNIYLESILENDWHNTPVSSCHGDFTLENLMVSNGEVYFIDFLDTFAETRLLDISKLLFDLRYFWSRRQVKRKAIVKNMHLDAVIRNTYLYKSNTSTINSLIALDILRILPYCKEDYLIKYLEKCLDHALQ